MVRKISGWARDAGGPRRAVDDRQLADQGAGPEDCENALAALTEIERHLQEPLDQPIATGARITGEKQHLPGLDRGDASLREQRIRKFGRQDRGMDVGGRRLSHGIAIRRDEPAAQEPPLPCPACGG